VGWVLAHQESQHLAERLLRETLVKEGIHRDQLTIHSDRGPAMRSQAVAQFPVILGVITSHSRPHVSDDSPFSESQFKTFKYRPDSRTGSDYESLRPDRRIPRQCGSIASRSVARGPTPSPLSESDAVLQRDADCDQTAPVRPADAMVLVCAHLLRAGLSAGTKI
jgi:transposase InsO family protein